MPRPAAPRPPVVRTAVVVLVGTLAALPAGAGAPDPDPAASAIDSGDLRAAAITLMDRLQRDPADGETRLKLARVYLRLGNGEAAEKELRLAERAGIAPERLDLPRVEADLLAGRNREALAALGRIAPRPEDRAQVQALTGRARLALGETEQARAAFTAAAELDPDNETAALGLLAVANREDPEGAAARTDALLARFPRSVEALLARAHLHIKAGQPGEAGELFARALERNPTSLSALGGLAVAQIATGDLAAAEATLDRLAASERDAALANYLRAIVALKRDDPAAARDALQAVLAAKPEDPQSRYLLGVLSLEHGQPETALELLSGIYRELPQNRAVAKALAATYLKLDAPERAVETLVRLTVGADAQLLTLLGVAYVQSGQTDKGLQWMQSAVTDFPDEVGLRPRLALSLAATGDLAAAESQLETELALRPGSTEAALLLTMTRIGKGDHDAALKSASEMVDRDPKGAAGYLASGLVHLEQGDAKEASAWFEKALAVDPDSIAAHGNLARIALTENDPDAATRHLEAIVRIDPGNPDALRVLMDIAANGSDREALQRWASQALRVHPDWAEPDLRLVRYDLARGDAAAAVAAANELAERFPGDREVLLAQASALGMAGDPRGAAAVLTRLADREPDSGATRMALGQALLLAGESERARQSFETVLAREPGSREAKIGLAAALWQSGQSVRTLDLAKSLQEEYPDDPAGYRIAGDVLFARGQWADAAAVLGEALPRQANGAVARSLAESLYRAGELPRATAVLEDWLQKDPRDVRAKAMLALYYRESGRPAEAIALFDDGDFGDPPDAPLMNNLAWMLQEAGDPRALDLARRAYELMPGRPEIADTYGWILVESGQAERAVDLLQRALLDRPGDPALTYRLALAYSENGSPDRAVQILRQILAERPSDPDASRARALLDRLK